MQEKISKSALFPGISREYSHLSSTEWTSTRWSTPLSLLDWLISQTPETHRNPMYSSYVLPPWLSILHLHWSKPKGDSGRIHFLRRRIRRFQRFVGDSGGLSAIYEHRRQRVARKQWGSEAWRFEVQRSAGDGDWGAPRSSSELTQYIIPIYGYGSIPINTIFRGMNIHLPAILMFTRGTRFWHTAIWETMGKSWERRWFWQSHSDSPAACNWRNLALIACGSAAGQAGSECHAAAINHDFWKRCNKTIKIH